MGGGGVSGLSLSVTDYWEECTYPVMSRIPFSWTFRGSVEWHRGGHKGQRGERRNAVAADAALHAPEPFAGDRITRQARRMQW